MIDLLEYAKAHRLRTRNLHDGRPLHPLRVPVGGRGRSAGYVGDDDRMDAIIGRHGYVTDEGGGRIGWYIHAGSRKGLNRWLPEIQAAEATIRQEGDVEAAGDAPELAMEALIGIIQPYRVKSGNAGSVRLARRTGSRIDANSSGGAMTPPQHGIDERTVA